MLPTYKQRQARRRARNPLRRLAKKIKELTSKAYWLGLLLPPAAKEPEKKQPQKKNRPAPKPDSKKDVLLKLSSAADEYEGLEDDFFDSLEKRDSLQKELGAATQALEAAEGKPQRKKSPAAVEIYTPPESAPISWNEEDDLESLKSALGKIREQTADILERQARVDRANMHLSVKLGTITTRLENLRQSPPPRVETEKPCAKPAPDLNGFHLAKINVAHRLPGSLEAIETWAQDTLADRMLILPRAIREAEKSGYGDPATLGNALLLLAHEYRDQIVGDDPASRRIFSQRLAQLHMRIGKTHSSTSGKLIRDRYTFDYAGRPTFFDTHLKKGNSRNPHRCLRVYFTFDEGKKMVVVGHMPTHLHNALS